MKFESLGFDEDYAEQCASNDFGRQVLHACSNSFHKEAGLPKPRFKKTIVEVAHQPLHEPRESFYRKFKVAQRIAVELNATLVWGVMDDDFFLFPGMWRGALSNREANPRRVAFWAIPKPLKLIKYPRAKSLAEYNAFGIARELRDRGVDAVCFQYSHLPFLSKQFNWFMDNAVAFRNAYNAGIKSLRIAGLRLLSEGELPLWKVNDDGSKEVLFEKDFPGKRIGFKAVARDIALADFLNTHTYVSGKGAASSYGLVTEFVRNELGLRKPTTVTV